MNTYRGIKILGEKPTYQKDEYGDIIYHYRGYDIERNSDVRSGEYGSFRVWIKGSRSWFWNLREALNAIDEHLGHPVK